MLMIDHGNLGILNQKIYKEIRLMDDEKFILWATLKILKLRKALDYSNSFFTTNELDMLFAIRDANQKKIRKAQKGKVIQLFT